MPRVINYHHHRPREGAKPTDRRPPMPDPWLYIGRRHPAFPEMPRGSALQNPFRLDDRRGLEEGLKRFDPANELDINDPTLPIELYRRHLRQKLKARDAQVIAALEAITEDTALVCFCVRPDGRALCHGQVVLEARQALITMKARKAAQEQEHRPAPPIQEKEPDPAALLQAVELSRAAEVERAALKHLEQRARERLAAMQEHLEPEQFHRAPGGLNLQVPVDLDARNQEMARAALVGFRDFTSARAKESRRPFFMAPPRPDNWLQAMPKTASAPQEIERFEAPDEEEEQAAIELRDREITAFLRNQIEARQYLPIHGAPALPKDAAGMVPDCAACGAPMRALRGTQWAWVCTTDTNHAKRDWPDVPMRAKANED